MRKVRLMLGVCLIGFASHAARISPDHLRDRLRSVQGRHYPELSGLTLELNAFYSDRDFFRSRISPWTVFSPSDRRRYLIEYNPKILNDPPSDAAIDAILAHELAHIRDYARMSAWDLCRFAVWYMVENHADYERKTDETVLEKGLGQGLAEFRTWLYAHLPPQGVAEKKRDYLTPEEIRGRTASPSHLLGTGNSEQRKARR